MTTLFGTPGPTPKDDAFLSYKQVYHPCGMIWDPCHMGCVLFADYTHNRICRLDLQGIGWKEIALCYYIGNDFCKSVCSITLLPLELCRIIISHMWEVTIDNVLVGVGERGNARIRMNNSADLSATTIPFGGPYSLVCDELTADIYIGVLEAILLWQPLSGRVLLVFSCQW